jgi:hypothetical protein
MRILLTLSLFSLSLVSRGQQIDSAILDAIQFTAELEEDTVKVSAVDTLIKGPMIHFDSNKHDFGTIQNGEIIHHTFTYKNTGSDTLYITGVTTDCGCTVPDLAEEMVLPDSTGIIKVTYNSKDDAGRVLQYLTVKHNSAKGYTFLTLSGFVNAKF